MKTTLLKTTLLLFHPCRRGLFSVLTALAGLGAGSGANASPPPDSILAMCTFQEGGGEVIRERSGVGAGMDLRIQNRSAVRWLDRGGVAVESPASIRSEAPASKIVRACKQSNEITLELWVVPANTKQAGPARIVTLSGGTTERNFTLGQHEDRYAVRVRTTAIMNVFALLFFCCHLNKKTTSREKSQEI